MGDLGCDWICDGCGAYLNDQPGFSAGNTWTCTECHLINDVSEGNIGTPEDDDCMGSPEYFRDEERARQEEEEDLWELGIDPND